MLTSKIVFPVVFRQNQNIYTPDIVQDVIDALGKLIVSHARSHITEIFCQKIRQNKSGRNSR